MAWPHRVAQLGFTARPTSFSESTVLYPSLHTNTEGPHKLDAINTLCASASSCNTGKGPQALVGLLQDTIHKPPIMPARSTMCSSILLGCYNWQEEARALLTQASKATNKSFSGNAPHKSLSYPQPVAWALQKCTGGLSNKSPHSSWQTLQASLICMAQQSTICLPTSW